MSANKVNPMSSILNNPGAMVALDTLKSINSNLGQVQSEISTGKKISSSTDNAAIWSIATVMQSDVDSFSQVSDSLNLGSATVGVVKRDRQHGARLRRRRSADAALTLRCCFSRWNSSLFPSIHNQSNR